nr:NAD(P)H-dependent oxidoreductase [Pseudoalteromonas citrea]
MHLSDLALNIRVNSLYTLYPDYKIDVLAEQSALLECDLIVFQYPLHWYSVSSSIWICIWRGRQ